MSQFLQEAEEGCLLLADITGYTNYLQGSELEHAEDVLADLLETIISGIEPPFELSKLEGDAAFAYLSATSISAPMLMDTIESTYFQFRRRLRDVIHATTCDCNACVLIPSLDLKFFVHQGTYVVRTIGRSEELTGSDVVLVHRLLKNSIRGVVGDSAYAAFTSATIDAIGSDPSVLGLVEHSERVDGEDVTVWLENLESRWRLEEERNRQYVSDTDAADSVASDFAVKPQELWPWLTEPSLRLKWQPGLTSIEETVDSRRGIGTVNHCAHGDEVILQQVVDWRPFSSFTTFQELGDSGIWLTVTTDLIPTASGTRVVLKAICDPDEAWEMVGPQIIEGATRDGDRLVELLAGGA